MVVNSIKIAHQPHWIRNHNEINDIPSNQIHDRNSIVIEQRHLDKTLPSYKKTP